MVMKKTIVYDPINGKSYREGDVKDAVSYFMLESVQPKIEVASELYITHARLLVRLEKFSEDDLIIEYKDEVITVNEIGQLSHWPEGFCDYTMKAVKALMTGEDCT